MLNESTDARRYIPTMPRTLLTVGTTKGAFFFETDEKHSAWKMTGPHLAGWEIYSLLCHQRGDGSPPRFLAGTSHWSYGATVRTSDDFGETWHQQEGRPEYPKETGWKLNKIWQLVAHPSQRDTLYAGVDEAGLFVSRDRGNTWAEITSLTRRPDRAAWQPGGGGLCLHTVVVDPTRPERIWIGISAVGAFRTDDSGATWTNLNATLPNQATGSPDNTVAHCIHKIVQDTKSPDTLYMQFHGGVYKSTDAGDHWAKIENGLPSNFGFPMAVTGGGDVFICPLDSDEKRYTKGGNSRSIARVTAARVGSHFRKGCPMTRATSAFSATR